MIDYFSPSARSVRILLSVFSFSCIALAAAFVAFPSLAALLQHLVHSDEPEWQAMYRELIARLPIGLIIAAAIARAMHFTFSHLSHLLRWWFSITRKRMIALTIVIALSVRMIWIFIFTSEPWADGIWYHQLAQHLAGGAGYTWADGSPTAFVPPGYPVVLSLAYRLFGDSLLTGKILNLVLSLAIVPLLFELFRNVWDERVARLAIVIYAFSIAQISFVGIVFSEMLFSVVLIAALICAVRSHARNGVAVYDLMIGIFTGAAGLIRPVGLLIPLAAVAAWLLHRMPLRLIARRIFIIGIVTLMMLIPTIVRNYCLFHEIVPVSTNGGMNFLIGNNAEVTGYYKMPSNIQLVGNEAEQNKQAYTLGFQWIRSHPVDALWGIMKKAFHLFHRNDSGILFSIVKTTSPVPWMVALCSIILENGMYYILIILTAIYIYRHRSMLRMNEYFLIFVWCSMTLLYLIYFGSHRFHVPYTLLLIGFTAAWICDGLMVEKNSQSEGTNR